ncbi:hypothetical protein EXU57_16640 [Segetibacter sp. 3557_3]|uniref:outer membrane beta-barrel protein n=1 Tax=Segetibacter sp. 3557_3 TaxID=2547429 RepID=UPI0010588247|nr:outer membrane beta-barrel protein [Segetibacter sp. 3557_3]TDH23437.1 hypothetical protein EXU57_16640 [Segetibacter sp. 3557_3]
MLKALVAFLLICFYTHVYAQVKPLVRITVLNDRKATLPGATVNLLTGDSVTIRTAAADSTGSIEFGEMNPGTYLVKASASGHEDQFGKPIHLNLDTVVTDTIVLQLKARLLNNVTVLSKKAFVQFLPDKTVINPEANITNAGATVMEVLEKSPGLTVGKDGSIIMKGKPAVSVFIDGKPTQLSGAELQSYLSGMSASLVEVIELIENPGAKYDAAGNAGIINIKTRANKQRGFNGSLSVSIGQGVYSKTGNTINLNYREGKMNLFMNYGFRANTEFQDIWSLRTYFSRRGADSALLEQPNFGKNTVSGQNVKTGVDFFVSSRTTLSLVFTGSTLNRVNNFTSAIKWMDPKFQTDSTINTLGENNMGFRRGGINLNARHTIDASSEWSFDVDYVKFNIANDQNYQTQLLAPGSPILATKGNTPSKLDIVTFKVDYAKRFKGFQLETGVKTAINKTDNLAEYFQYYSANWVPDLSRSNHFLYKEKISAAYGSIDAKQGKWHWQAGLRYEITSYKAYQLGNAEIKDSAFNRNYGSLFPTAFVSYKTDSNNMFTLRTGRRIDRPPFQNLNPFLRTLNKYTYEGGNPFIKPQYTWNFALAHTYKQRLTTELSYGYLRDYFSQIFVIDSSSSNINRNIIIYTRGNVGSFQNFGLSETYQVPVTRWWNLTAVAQFNHKIIKGVVWAPLKVNISQLNISLNNQFQFNKGWGAEISGYYQTRSQIDLQEWLEPQGELNLGVSKQILKGAGSLKLGIRDITYFQNYSGYSTFENSHEPFRIQWDSRVARLTFSWRFGQTLKALKRSEGGATEEINRVGSGN